MCAERRRSTGILSGLWLLAASFEHIGPSGRHRGRYVGQDHIHASWRSWWRWHRRVWPLWSMHRTCRGASSTCCCRIGLNGPLRAHAPPTQQRLARCLLVSGIYCIGAAEISVGSWGPLHKDQYRKVSDRGHVHGMVLCATRDRLLASAKCTARYHSPVSENVDDQAKQWPHRSQKIDIKLSCLLYTSPSPRD